MGKVRSRLDVPEQKDTAVDKTQDRLAAHERQLERVQRRMDRLNMRSLRYKGNQMAVIVIGILLAIPLLTISHWLGLVEVVAGVIAIVVFIRRQRKAEASFLKHRSLREFLLTQVARMRLDWAGLPAVAPRDTQVEHPFDNDLDITGERSLHKLINTGVSSDGIQRLRGWLLDGVPELEVLRRRQGLVRELAPLTRFRNKFMQHSLFATRFSSEPIESSGLVSWLEKQVASSVRQRRWTLWVACILSASIFISLVLFIYAQTSALFCVTALLLSFSWFLYTRKEQGNLADDVQSMRFTLNQLRPIFEYLEKYPYAQHSQLKTLCEPFFIHGDRRPSFLLKELAHLAGRANMAASTSSWLAINTLFPVGAFTAYQLDRYKAQILQHLPAWLDTWYELEALCGLANFAYLNPDYVMPTITTGSQQEQPTLLRARKLGHPLIARENKVTNDFSINHLGEILLITGSNMAGKSTFLRTVGINLCLAYAGTVVNAASLQTACFELYACIKVTDSLADGYSYFYAEVRRLKGLLTLLERGTTYPLFYMIDEIFKGTNNYERLIGSEAYIRALIGKNCVGAISTHDLELVRLAEPFPEITNVHFREDVVDGHMVFDYIMRPGPSPTRNALKIMQLEGLPVRWDEEPRPSRV